VFALLNKKKQNKKTLVLFKIYDIWTLSKYFITTFARSWGISSLKCKFKLTPYCTTLQDFLVVLVKKRRHEQESGRECFVWLSQPQAKEQLALIFTRGKKIIKHSFALRIYFGLPLRHLSVKHSGNINCHWSDRDLWLAILRVAVRILTNSQ